MYATKMTTCCYLNKHQKSILSSKEIVFYSFCVYDFFSPSSARKGQRSINIEDDGLCKYNSVHLLVWNIIYAKCC